jgi:hypothetical protein
VQLEYDNCFIVLPSARRPFNKSHLRLAPINLAVCCSTPSCVKSPQQPELLRRIRPLDDHTIWEATHVLVNLTQISVLGSSLDAAARLTGPPFSHYRSTVMASIHTDSIALRQSIEVPPESPREERSKPVNKHAMSIAMPPEERIEFARAERAEAGEPPSQDNCDAQHDASDPRIALSSKSKLVDQTVAPFLAKHIPDQYAPLGVQPRPTTKLFKDPNKKDPNTKYCYRHRPDSKCRRTADEPRMENLQRVC